MVMVKLANEWGLYVWCTDVRAEDWIMFQFPDWD